MSIWIAVLIGIVYGAAEILPVSVSGHMAMLHSFLRIGTEDHALFDALLHLSALGAIWLAFRKDLRAMRREGAAMLGLGRVSANRRPDRPLQRIVMFLLLAAVPLIAAEALRGFVRPLGENTFLVGFLMILTGFLLLAADRWGHGNKNERGVTLSEAMTVTFFQMLSVIPGLSRSAAGIGVGMLCGFDRTFAARFSLLLYLPALLGAFVVSLIAAVSAGVVWSLVPVYLVGAAVSFLISFLAVYALRLIVLRGKAGGFCYYCWGAGLLTLILSLIS